ncbi:hypothetical protein C8R45DRAFT_941122 [Mycena sanguinolenta]|nr:hypothetical protein C8R45DRAFT_941122 [Mycena sanguinolenta]
MATVELDIIPSVEDQYGFYGVPVSRRTRGPQPRRTLALRVCAMYGFNKRMLAACAVAAVTTLAVGTWSIISISGPRVIVKSNFNFPGCHVAVVKTQWISFHNLCLGAEPCNDEAWEASFQFRHTAEHPTHLINISASPTHFSAIPSYLHPNRDCDPRGDGITPTRIICAAYWRTSEHDPEGKMRRRVRSTSRAASPVSRPCARIKKSAAHTLARSLEKAMGPRPTRCAPLAASLEPTLAPNSVVAPRDHPGYASLRTTLGGAGDGRRRVAGVVVEINGTLRGLRPVRKGCGRTCGPQTTKTLTKTSPQPPSALDGLRRVADDVCRMFCRVSDLQGKKDYEKTRTASRTQGVEPRVACDRLDRLSSAGCVLNTTSDFLLPGKSRRYGRRLNSKETRRTTGFFSLELIQPVRVKAGEVRHEGTPPSDIKKSACS